MEGSTPIERPRVDRPRAEQPRADHTAAERPPHAADADQEPVTAPVVTETIARTQAWLLSQQLPEGNWCAELEGDSILQSETILLLAWLGRERDELAAKLARYMLTQQREDGTWGQYPGSVIDISTSVKAYFALKLTGHSPSAKYMVKARDAILTAGGADKVNSFTRFYLALLGQIPFELCPAVPPEMVLLPTWFPINIYRMSSWSRTIFVPLSIVWAKGAARDMSSECSIRELFVQEPKNWPELRCPGQEKPKGLLSWDRFFRTADKGLKLLEKFRILPFRKRALRKSLQWMLDRFPESDGLGAIYPPIVWSAIALKALGYSEESPEFRTCMDELDKLMIHEGDTTRVQPCKSPVWDTSIALRSLAAAGVGVRHPQTRSAVDWLLSKEVRVSGDWRKTVNCEPGGWFFEYNNVFYPDLDDTAMVLMSLREQLAEAGVQLEVHPGDSMANTSVLATSAKVPAADAPRELQLQDGVSAATKRALTWIAAMQNRDGGWGAFDKDNDAEFLCQVPFADHNAMIDPSTPDLAARVIEALGQFEITQQSKGKLGDVVRKSVAYIRESQYDDGSWFGRWGVNYIYGTWQCLVGLTAVGVSTDDAAIQRGAQWLLNCQQPCGGWGETCDTYENEAAKGSGIPTASQTAWAILGLISAGHGNSDAVRRGVEFLKRSQAEDGTWEETPFTGTGFPRVFYLRYHYYRIYFPLLALATYAKLDSGQPPVTRRRGRS